MADQTIMDVVLQPGSTTSIQRVLKGGWYISFVVGGANAQIAFTDSVDMIDWLSQVAFRSDGGKQSTNWETSNGAGGPSHAPAKAG